MPVDVHTQLLFPHVSKRTHTHTLKTLASSTAHIHTSLRQEESSTRAGKRMSTNTHTQTLTSAHTNTHTQTHTHARLPHIRPFSSGGSGRTQERVMAVSGALLLLTSE
jgi:hypothetical protein